MPVLDITIHKILVLESTKARKHLNRFQAFLTKPILLKGLLPLCLTAYASKDHFQHPLTFAQQFDNTFLKLISLMFQVAICKYTAVTSSV